VLRLVKPTAEATDFTVEGVPAGRELAFPAAGNPVGAALADLQLDGVEPAAGFDPGDVKPTVARFETFDGLVVEVSTYKLASGTRMRFAASADQALAERFAPPGSADEAAKADAAQPSGEAPAPPSRKPFAEVKAEAGEMAGRLGNWVYAIAEYRTEQLTRRLEDLLQPKAKPGRG
jgi:hypothetical protein